MKASADKQLRALGTARDRAAAGARPRTLREALKHGRAALARHRCARTEADLEAEALLAAAARVTRVELFTHALRALSPAAWRRYDALLARRLAHEPLDYILGFASFDRITVRVNRGTLVPRPATEVLVEAAAEAAAAMPADTVIADLGTGSGCIALALANRFPKARVMATDESDTALRAARANARRLELTGRVTFLRGDFAAPLLTRLHGRPLLLVTNPPYITSAQMPRLPVDIRLYEPASALDGGRDGLDCFRVILDQLRGAKTGPVTFFGEHLAGQYAKLAREIKQRFPQAKPERIHNLSGIIIGTKCRLR